MGLFSSKQKSETERKVTPYDRRQFRSWADRYFGLSEQPFEFFEDQTYADLQPLQEEALGMREAYARGLGGMIDPTMSAFQSTLQAPDVAANPYVQGMLEQQANLLNRNLSENVLPSIRSGAIGAGQLGSSRQGVAEGIAARGTQEALAAQAAETQMGAYGQGLQQQRFGLGAAPGMAQFGMMPANVLAGVGDVRRQEEQRAIDEQMARFQFEQEEPWQRLERFAGTYMPATRPFATTTTTQESKTSPSGLQIGSQLAGLGMAGYGMFNPASAGANILGGGGNIAQSMGRGFGAGMMENLFQPNRDWLAFQNS